MTAWQILAASSGAIAVSVTYLWLWVERELDKPKREARQRGWDKA